MAASPSTARPTTPPAVSLALVRDRRTGGNRGQRFVDAVVDRAVIEAVATVAGVPDIGADLRGGDCRSGVGAVAGNRNGADRAWWCCWARSEVKVMLPPLVVSTGDRGRIAEQGDADDSAGRFAGAGDNRGAGGNRGQRFVGAVVDRAVIEAVAAVAGVPDVGADFAWPSRWERYRCQCPRPVRCRRWWWCCRGRSG